MILTMSRLSTDWVIIIKSSLIELIYKMKDYAIVDQEIQSEFYNMCNNFWDDSSNQIRIKGD